MVRIERLVTVNSTYDIFVEHYLVWIQKRPAITEPEPAHNISSRTRISTTLNFYGEQLDLTSLTDYLAARRITLTDDGISSPEPVPGPIEPPPTRNELAAAGFYRQAFNEEFDSMIAAINTAIEARYNTLNTTPIAFADVPKVDIKHLRQRA